MYNKCVVVGNGMLADKILSELPRHIDIAVERYQRDISSDEMTLFVHVGSGRQYGEALEKAAAGDSLFIQGATEKNIPMAFPESGTLRYVHAPNLDLNLINFFRFLSLAAEVFNGEVSSVVESHQKEKTSIPGTAYKICDYLGFPKSEIVSIRDPERQKDMGIVHPERHAYHRVQFGDEDSRITFETKVEGLGSYVSGLAELIRISSNLEKMNYEVEELLAKRNKSNNNSTCKTQN